MENKKLTELERCEFAKSKGYTYDPSTGEMRGVFGKIMKCKKREGYVHISLYKNGKNLKVFGHRLAWYLYYGELPNNFIDHIDGDKTNNKIENLRNVTQQQNCFNNIKAKGYSWNKERKKFHARIRLNDRLIHLGFFANEEDAKKTYIEAKKKYHVIPSSQNSEK